MMVTLSHSSASSLRMCELMKMVLPMSPQLAQDFHQFDAGARVETGGRLIEQQQLGIVHQHAGRG